MSTIQTLNPLTLTLNPKQTGILPRLMVFRLSSGTMTPLFVSRIFEEHAPARSRNGAEGEPLSSTVGEMDFTAFVDFALAWDHRATEAGVQYFFSVLDIHSRGYITQVRN